MLTFALSNIFDSLNIQRISDLNTFNPGNLQSEGFLNDIPYLLLISNETFHLYLVL